MSSRQDVNDQGNSTNSKTVILTLPYKGDKGVEQVQKLKRTTRKFLPPDVKAVFAFKANKLASRFKLKDSTNFQHNTV